MDGVKTIPGHGLSVEQLSAIESIRVAIGNLRERVALLPAHRCMSLAITKLDEASLWLGERAMCGPEGR